MSTLAFFPWLQISEVVSMEGFELIPYQRGVEPAGEGTKEQSTLDQLLNPYYSGGSPVEVATILRIGGQELTRDLSEEERTSLFTFSELLSAAGLAAREFFSFGNYQNRNNFRLVIQGFSGEKGGANITTRRRNGSANQNWNGNSYRVQKPEHISLHGHNPIDFSLLRSLMASREHQYWQRIYESIISFNLANTDSPDISENIEAVLLNGALERLLGCNRGKEDDLAERFSAALAPTEDKHPSSSCAQLSAYVDRSKKSSCIRDVWIRDLWRLRGNLAHGKIESPHKPVWNLRNHLLLGSFVFPLTLKSQLQSIGFYSLTDQDQKAIDIFELLACEDHFAPVEHPSIPGSHPWNRIKKEFDLLCLRRKLAEEVKKHFGDETEDEGS